MFSQIRVIDGHIHHGFEKDGPDIRLSGLNFFYERGIEGFCYPLPVNKIKCGNLYSQIKSEIAQLKKMASGNRNFQLWKKSKSGVRKNVLTCIPGIEYFSGVFNNDPAYAVEYKALGICYVTLVDNEFDNLFDNGMLTAFGKKLVTRMNEVGLIIDISHLSRSQRISVIKFSKSPVIVSHTNVGALANLDYNLSDIELTLLKENDALVMVSFNKNGLFNGEDGDGIQRVTDNIEYLSQKIGIHRIGIGSDYQSNGKYVARGLNGTDIFTSISEELLKRGFTQHTIDDVFYNNFINFIQKTY